MPEDDRQPHHFSIVTEVLSRERGGRRARQAPLGARVDVRWRPMHIQRRYMATTTQISKWGNSLGLRLPKSVAREAQLDEGDTVDVVVKDGAIVIRPSRPTYSLAQLVARITPRNRHGESDWGEHSAGQWPQRRYNPRRRIAMTRLWLLLLLIAATGFRLSAQQSAPAFEVASIKVSKTGLPGNIWGGGPGRFVVDGITAANLIRNAYDLRPEEVIGGPAWLDAERFQINATYPPESGTPQVNAMLRSLLRERFALTAHREQRELPKFHLVIADAKGRLGPQLKKSTPQCPRPHPETPCTMRAGGGELVMQEATIRQFLDYLESLAGGRIEDRSGLTGEYDLTLSWSRGSNDVERPSIFTAVQEQLRLKLEPTRGAVDVLVIDSIERPTPD